MVLKVSVIKLKIKIIVVFILELALSNMPQYV